MTADVKRRKRISFFGNFGMGNLGNESTLQAILHAVRRYLPDAEVLCICTGPSSAGTMHKIRTVAMTGKVFLPELLQSGKVARFLRKLLVGVPSEVYRWVHAFITLRGMDMLIVPGTQFLSDNLTSPFGWPYLAFKWSIAAKLRGCRIYFVSVGVGPLNHPISRCFIKCILFLASYRSYRDEVSRDYLRCIGYASDKDPVYPDLAFSLPVDASLRTSWKPGKFPIVAVGVKDFHGQYGRVNRVQRGEIIYREYIKRVRGFVAWLLKEEYTVRCVIGDMCYDDQVRQDLRRSLINGNSEYDKLAFVDEPIESVEELIQKLSASDIVVSPRFHNVVLALLLNKPVIAIGYHEKFSDLMKNFGLTQYNLQIETFDVTTVIDKIVAIRANTKKINIQVTRKVQNYRKTLEEQYKCLFGFGRPGGC